MGNVECEMAYGVYCGVGFLKLKKLILENFRSYHNRTIIEFNDLTVFVGRNDAGKSSILDALDIFFNDGKGTIKIDKEDLNKQAENDDTILIGAVFTDLPEQLIVDSSVSVSLKNEYLLNKEGDLEIHEFYRNGRLQGTYIYANHPVNNEFLRSIMSKTVTQLRKHIESKGIPCSGDMRVASQLRKCIRQYYKEKDGELRLEEINVKTTEGGGRDIWSRIQQYLPLYALFKADKQITDTQPEVQDPIKLAIREILNQENVMNKLNEIAETVKNSVAEVIEMTLRELKRISPQIAGELKASIPETSSLKWEDAFKKIRILSDEDIPLNKRGSGVRRLVLLSFFSAQAKRRQQKEGLSSITYAIEEPETSQHPDHQKLLINSLIKLSQTPNTQIILTTHSPAIAQLLPVDSLRLVEKTPDGTKIHKPSEDIIQRIADMLGVLPNLTKLVICVEGENDRHFLYNINQNIPELKNIVDLTHRQISIIPMNGTNLKHWVNRRYLADSGVIEYHLYDRDTDEKYRKTIEKINKHPVNKGTLTKKREIENYIHWKLIEEHYKIQLSEEVKKNWDNTDIPRTLQKLTGKTEKTIKKELTRQLSKKMTRELFEELNAWDEVQSWFQTIKQLLNHVVTT